MHATWTYWHLKFLQTPMKQRLRGDISLLLLGILCNRQNDPDQTGLMAPLSYNWIHENLESNSKEFVMNKLKKRKKEKNLLKRWGLMIKGRDVKMNLEFTRIWYTRATSGYSFYLLNKGRLSHGDLWRSSPLFFHFFATLEMHFFLLDHFVSSN